LKRLATFGLILLGLLAVLGVTLDFFAKAYAEEQIGEAITHRSQNVGQAKADISSFPFTGRLIVQGRVEHLTISMSELRGFEALVDEVDVKMDGLEMDRSSLVGRQHVEIKSVDAVTVTALVSAGRLQELANKVGVLLGFSNGRMTAGGQVIDVVQDGDAIVLRGGVIPSELRVPIPAGDINVLPCTPTVRVTEQGIVLSCRAEHPPKILVDAIGSLAMKQQLGG